MSKETIKQQVIEAIEAARPRILALGDELLHTPETAFKETRSSAIMRRELTSLGLPCRDGLALTGLRADLRSGGADRPCHSWPNWTRSACPATLTPIRSPARRMPAVIMRRVRP